MKKWILLMAACVPLLILAFLPGCSDDDEQQTTPTPTEFEMLTSYLDASNLDLPDLLNNWIIDATTLQSNGLTNYFIVDVRTGDAYRPDTLQANGVVDFEDGHIEGAHKVALADVVTYVEANNTGGLPVVVVCYTGHSAGHAVMALRLSGHADAQVLKWGMSGWNSAFAMMWNANAGDAAIAYPGSWEDGDPGTPPPALPNNTGRPELNTAEQNGAAILDYQIAATVLDGYNGISNTSVLDAPANYNIICYWDLTPWDQYGNITGAYLVPPGELNLSTLGCLDPEGVNVVYCWTGHTASLVAAWLNVLGYDAKALSYSANGMIHSNLAAGGTKWDTVDSPAELDYVTGP